MPAYYRLFRVRVIIYGAHNARRLAFPAAYALVLDDDHPATRPFFERMAGAYFHAGGFIAAEAHDGNEVACHAASRPHFYRGFDDRVILFVDDRANAHTSETTKAFVHFHGFQYFSHRSAKPFSLIRALRVRMPDYM